MSSNEKWIIERGNGLYNLLWIVFIIITLGLCFLLHSFEIERSYKFMIGLNGLSLAIMIPYRIRLAFDSKYMNYVYPGVKRSYLFELPFFPCNVVEILLFFAYVFRSRLLLSYCFFIGTIGTTLAFSFPAKGFERENLLNYRMIGFYSTHFLSLMNVPLMIASGIFIPQYSDVFRVLCMYLSISFIMHLLNMYINSLHLGYKANYHFVSDPDFNPIYRKVYDFIPYNFFYTIPIDLFLTLLMAIVVFVIHLFI